MVRNTMDGKTMTLTVKALVLAPGQGDRGVLPAGSSEVDIMVFEKQ